MDNEFYTLLTDRGMAKIASALADKKQLHLQKMAVGDGGGQYYEPIASQTKLRHEVWRGEMNTLTVAPNNPNWLIAELVLPEDVGGWYVREVGVFDDEGELIAIGKFPESYKPLLPGGCGKQVCIRLIMEVSNTTAVTLTVDPSIVLATRDYVDTRLDEHEHSTNHPDATLTQKGFTQLSNATDSDDETKAATPKAVKAAMAEARNHTHTWNQITGVPDGTLTQKGIVKLNNATDSTSTTEAATPSAVKAAYDKASAAAPANHSHYQFFTANGTFTVPDGVTQVFVEMLGGGGGGGGGGHTSNTDGLLYCSGGNAGKSGEPEIAIVPVIAGNNYPVTVGAGGASGAGGVLPNSNPTGNVVQVGQAGNSGINGGNSIFIDVVANGGAGGAGGIVQSRIPLSGFNQLDSISGGNAETTFFGKGGTGAVLSNGSNASGYGAGGGGGASVNSLNIALSGYAGGRGSSGFVKISW
ncbi:phage tail protein [Salmonella enterica subsp. enterica serovar Typhimurium]|uniref:phage tail protein n=1 Tax=Salmonella enterica TaxID=28901 RepID=UPI0007793637|nr:phage tail protein [Salmonella enterica]KYD36373.1 phage tail protein [Salmonella enterica subsp. enterica serovar Typhimurium]KYD41662.1 phage tail protein [Salmonella enterica subsp. enterica serovar Typhimurium]KYD46702.1 phage tail protein [Salmonella enterica subsp. enterica serovar Typhimurium]KYD51729.1 phage tail protein [Salmonella enterica subsp. enterica serovar Typhimurium]KYD65699.1 phage tail protein [Salmonella enterica subsp. enterica serovar Typhimurium]